MGLKHVIKARTLTYRIMNEEENVSTDRLWYGENPRLTCEELVDAVKGSGHVQNFTGTEMHLKMHESQFDGGSSEVSKNPASNGRTAETFDV